MSGHRPEVGRARGVDAWAADYYPGWDGWSCVIVCTQGHAKRTIERVIWAGGGGGTARLYTEDHRGIEYERQPMDEPGTSVEEIPAVSHTYKTRLRCPCGLDVALSRERVERLVEGLHDAGIRRIELAAIAASLSG